MAKEVFKIISNDVKLKSNKNNPSSERIINTFVNAHLYEKVVYEVLNNNESDNQNSNDDFKKISSIAHAFPTVDRLHNNLMELFKSTFTTIENFNKENILVIKRLSMDSRLLIFVNYLYRLQDVFEPKKFINTWWTTLFKPILLNSRWRDLIKVTQNILIHFCIGNEIYKNTDIEDIIKEYQCLIIDTYITEQKNIIGQLSKGKKIENKLYDTTFSANLENLIIQIGISKPKDIFQDLNEQFIGNNRLEVISVLSKIATMEQFPVHFIVETKLFNSLLCSIAVDEYAPIVCGCLTVLTILIPRIFNHLPNILEQLFSLLIRSILWERKYVKTIKHYLEEINLENQNKDYSLKEKHQDVALNNLMALYSSQTLWNTILNYFTFLYGMFPCNLLAFTKKLFEDLKVDSDKTEDIIENNENLKKYIYKNLPFYSLNNDEIEGFKKYKDVFSSIRYIPKSHTSDIQYLEQAFNVILEDFLIHPDLMFSNTEKEKTDLSKWIQEDASVITLYCLELYRPLKLNKKSITNITNGGNGGLNNDDENITEISFIKHNSYDSKVLPTWNMTQLNMALSNVPLTHSRAWAHETVGSRIPQDHNNLWKPTDEDFSEKVLDSSLEGNNMFDMDKEIKKLNNFDTNIWDKVTTSNLSQRRKFTNKTQSHFDRRKIVPDDDIKYTEHYIKVHNFEKQATLDNFLNNNNNDNSQTFGSYNSKEPTEIEQRFINSDSIENIYSNSTVDDGFGKSILNNKSSLNNITIVSVTSNADKQSLDDSIVSEMKNDKILNKSLSSIVTSLSNDTTTNDDIMQNQNTPKLKPSNSSNKFSTSTSIPGLNTNGNGITSQASTTVMSSNLSAIHHYQSHGNIQSILQQKSISQIINEGNSNNNNNNGNNSNLNINNINNNSNSLLNNTTVGIDPHINSLTNDAEIILNIFSELRTSLSSFFYSLKILEESVSGDKNSKENSSKLNNISTLSSNNSLNNTSSISTDNLESINLELDISRIHIFLLLNDLNYETYLRQSYLYSIRKLKKDLIAMEYKKNENLALVDKYRYQSQEIIYLQEQLDCQRVELHAIKDRYNSYQEGLTQQLYSLSKENAESTDNIARLKDHLLECENIINNQKNRLDQANEKIFQLENCLSIIQPQVTKQEEMEKHIEQLTKQLLLWEDDSETNEVTLKQMEEMANQIYNLELIINSYKKELSEVKLALTEKNTLNNTLLTKLANIERYNEKEENTKNEYTETINRQRSLFDQQVQILEDKYQGVKQINLQLEMKIMNLQCELEKANLEVTKNKQLIERINKEKNELAKETLQSKA